MGDRGDRGAHQAETPTVRVGADEDPHAAPGGDVVRRQRVDVAADGSPAQRRLPRAGLPAPHSRRPHGRRLPAWLYKHKHANTCAISAQPGAQMEAFIQAFSLTHGALKAYYSLIF